MILRCICLLLTCLPFGKLLAQSVDFGTIKDDVQKRLKAKPFEISGGASLNAIYTEGSQPTAQPFTYVASANVVDISTNYSNFQSYSFIQTGFERINRLTALDNLDTLSYTQLAQNASLNVAYKIGQTEKKTQALTASINFMESAKAENTAVQQNNATQFINGLCNYTVSWTPQSLSVATGVNYAVNYAPNGTTVTIGPTLSAAKPFFNKLVMGNAAWAYNQSRSQGRQSRVTTLSIGASTTVKKKHNITFNLVGQIQRTLIAKPNINITATAGYSYSF